MSLIISPPEGYTIHRCVAEKGKVRAQPPVALNMLDMKVWNGETFDVPNFDQPVNEFFRPGLIFIVPDTAETANA